MKKNDPSSDAVIEAYKKDIDRTLIRENLKLTHEERLPIGSSEHGLIGVPIARV